MKKQVLLAALSLLSIAPNALVAKTLEQAYIDSYVGRTGMPVPTWVESPVIGTDYIGTTVDVKFTVDERGQPYGIVAMSAAEDEVIEKVITAVSRWEFIPLRDGNGKPKSANVALPVRIIERQTR
jgi:hypothetical protein